MHLVAEQIETQTRIRVNLPCTLHLSFKDLHGYHCPKPLRHREKRPRQRCCERRNLQVSTTKQPQPQDFKALGIANADATVEELKELKQ